MKTNDFISDFGPNPVDVNLEKYVLSNGNYRAALWTGKYLQLTLMNIKVQGEIGLEIHHDTDQFLKIEYGYGLVKMGKCKNKLDYVKRVQSGYAVFVPAGIWHNLINIGSTPLKLYSIYAPPHHPRGTIQKNRPISDYK